MERTTCQIIVVADYTFFRQVGGSSAANTALYLVCRNYFLQSYILLIVICEVLVLMNSFNNTEAVNLPQTLHSLGISLFSDNGRSHVLSDLSVRSQSNKSHKSHRTVGT